MNKNIGAQFFTLREHMKTLKDFDLSCKRIKEMGYKIVQVSGISLDASDIKKILDKYSLKVVTTHRSFDDFVNRLDDVIEYNKILGSDLCGLGMMPVEFGKTRESLTEFIKEINKICDALKKENMYFGYHNHSFEFAKIGSHTIMDLLVEETNPETFNFIIDTYWLQLGGVNPSEYIKKLKGRAMAVHFKDFKINSENWTVPEMAPVGSGNLDWDAIISACDEAGTKWALVEHDNAKDPFKSLKAGYDYLSTKGFC